MRPRVRRLADHLTVLLLVAMLGSFTVAACLLTFYRVPVIERQAHAVLQGEVDSLRDRLGLLRQTLERRLEQVAMLLDQVSAAQATGVLDAGIDAALVTTALYRTDADGRLQALGLPGALRARRADWLGSDLSRSPLWRALGRGPALAWDAQHRSPVTGVATVAVGLRDAQGRVLVAEMPAAALLRRVALAGDNAPMWALDRGGALVAPLQDGDAPDAQLQAWLRAAAAPGVAPEPAPPSAPLQARWRAAVAEVPALGWRIVGRMPSGLGSPQVRRLFADNAVALVASLLAGIGVAVLWARRMARPLEQTVVRARQAMDGALPLPPEQPSTVAEFNQLALQVEAMAVALHRRELRWRSVFDATPLAMAVCDTRDAMRLRAVNASWCRDFGYAREEAVGRTTAELGLVVAPPDSGQLAQLMAAGPVHSELQVPCRDGTALHVLAFGPHPVPGADGEVIWASMDIGPLRQAEQAVRELNQQLEARVAQRTAALADANAALTRTAEELRLAQADLVQAGKMAALGTLVAGIAAELQSPLGNGVLAIGSLAAVLERFDQARQAGLRRADLEAFLAGVQDGTEIAVRSLRRAAELVQNFKQVAVDQTSAQRRRFELHEVVRDMAASLRPGLAGTPYTLEEAVPTTGLALESYPGALGQALGQLVHNAVQHGLKGRARGSVRISGGRSADRRIWLRVADDGRGMAADVLARIVDPPAAAADGRSGAGLGLQICAHAVTALLGGTLTAHSTEGRGSWFEMQLPVQAPAQGEDRGSQELSS